MLVSMLHHVEKPAAALAEAQRILRPQGRLALMGFTCEDVARTWLEDPFPSTRVWMDESHPTLAALQALLPGARRIPVTYTDLEDGSLAAPAGHPEKLADPRWHRQTSFFERLEREWPDELRAGLERLRSDLAARLAPRRPGPATVLAADQPSPRPGT
jgi:SAM-dependent methyltransferase